MINDTKSAEISQTQDEHKYICNHENNVPSWLSPQWLYGNSCTHAVMQKTVHHVSKCMSCHKAIVVTTRSSHSFHDHTHTDIYRYIDIYIHIYIHYIYIYTYIRIYIYIIIVICILFCIYFHNNVAFVY